MLVVATPAAALPVLTEALDAHRAHRPVKVVEPPEIPPSAEWWAENLEEAAAAWLVVPADLAPEVAAPGTHLTAKNGRHVPVGLVRAESMTLTTIASLQHRLRIRLGAGPVVLLASREERARELVAELQVQLRRGRRLPFARFTAERLPRYALPDALAWGPGVAIYVGQGHTRGWAGYGGVEAWLLDVSGARPLGAILSVTCHAATRISSAPSFSEELVGRGRCAAALGSIDLTPHVENRSLALAVVRRLADGATTLADALPVGHLALARYRLIGDPLAPLIGARGARRGIASVFAPGADDQLPPVDWLVQAESRT
jgi:hypothetical protein